MIEVQINTINLSDKLNLLYKKTKNTYLVIATYLTIISYFYNIGIIEFNFLGENPLRIYDFTGIIFLWFYFKNINILNKFILSLPTFKWFYYFVIYSLFSMFFFTAIFSIFNNDIFRLIQSLIYFYHLFIFFISGVFFLILSFNHKIFKNYVYLFVILSIIEFLIIILQNFDILPFLWSDKILSDYFGFLSGTLGPNKIVVGMTSLTSIILTLALYYEKLKINKLLLLINLFLSSYVLLLSGSRTSYVGLIVFLIAFFIKSPLKLIQFSIILLTFLILMLNYQPVLFDKAKEVFDYRVTNKIVFDEYDSKVEELYDDLGAGRKQLMENFIKKLAEYPYFIPTGTGFNNRFLFKTSPHNMYLTLIRDTGLIGLFLYFNWLISYMLIKSKKFKILKNALLAITASMMVTLFFGEHLYIFRPLYGLLGLYFFVTSLFIAPIIIKYESK